MKTGFDRSFARTVALRAAVVLLVLVSTVRALPRAGVVDTVPSPGAFCLADRERVAAIYVDPADSAGVSRAAKDLAQDVGRVTGKAGRVVTSGNGLAGPVVIIGTLGKSRPVDALVAAGKVDVGSIRGKWESYVIQIVNDPMPGVKQALVIAGSDKRGTIYGLYDVSETIGVSPWYWWADVPPTHHDAIYWKPERVEQGPPAVKYRGIFINDEAPCLTGWAKASFGGLNSKMYTHVFELLLRLRANYMWPAMWGNAFNEDDPLNPTLADEYGIVMGTSHQEPMLRAQAEFDRRFKPALWNYATHPDVMETFWRDGVRRNKDYESLITLGMRGRDDTEMIEGATIEQSVALTERIVAKQRQILQEEIRPDVTSIPQMWCLYKEVQGYYEHGLRVPDDVTLLWAEDNWGNLRRVPTAQERQRAGGAGIYYHFDYVGSVRNYKWINTNPLPKIQEQMHHAFANGADRIWIVNVGDLKPMELPISFFMTMAWDPAAMTADRVGDFTRQWAAQQFGPEHADAIAAVVSRYGKQVGWRKPELIGPTTFSLIHYNEAERVEAAWADLLRRAEAVNVALRPEQRDAYFQLVLHPIRAMANLTNLYVATGRNAMFAEQGRVSANEQAARVQACFARDQAITADYHALGGGKWNHMMDQVHIGYTGWQDPKANTLPPLKAVTPIDGPAVGVAVEGSAGAWPGAAGSPTLPAIDTPADQRRWIDVFARGTKAVQFTATATDPWVRVAPASGDTAADRRLSVSVDWTAVPVGRSESTIVIAADNGERVTVRVPVVHDPQIASNAPRAGSLTEAYAIAAADAVANDAVNGVRWQRLPDYGRVGAAMSVFPVTAASVVPPNGSPCLSYDIVTPQAGDVNVTAVIGPTLPFVAGRGLKLAVSIDDAGPVTVDAATKPFDPTWGRAVSDNARLLPFNLKADRAGRHTLKVWMVDAGVVLQELIVGRSMPSYFGPAARTVGPAAE